MVQPDASVKIILIVLVIGAGFALAIGGVLSKRFGPFKPMKLMAWMLLFTVSQVMIASLFIEQGQLDSLRNAAPSAWLALVYTVLFGAIAGWGLWFWLFARCSMARVAPFALLQILFAVAAGLIFLHEHLTGPLIMGAVICSVGLIITQRRSLTRPEIHQQLPFEGVSF